MSRCYLLVLLTWLSLPLSAQTFGDADPLFSSDEVLQVTMTGPIEQLIKERSKEDYLEGKFDLVTPAGENLSFDVKFRARGNFRHERCDYPPVRLNFKKSQVEGTLLANQNILKLVVHCNKRAEYQQIILQEYLAYRIFNLLTDLSLRVRLLQIVYVDPSEGFRSEPRYAFLIEHKKRAAARFGLQEFETERAQVGMLDRDQLNLTSVFQYFIGNTDFSPIAGPPDEGCCHNYILFANGDEPPASPVPYDFDQSGFVDAPYGEVNARFKLRNAKQRLYRGRCFNNDYIDASVQRFRDQQDAIYALIETQQGLDDKHRKALVKFVDRFYKTIEKPKNIDSAMRKRCV